MSNYRISNKLTAYGLIDEIFATRKAVKEGVYDAQTANAIQKQTSGIFSALAHGQKRAELAFKTKQAARSAKRK